MRFENCFSLAFVCTLLIVCDVIAQSEVGMDENPEPHLAQSKIESVSLFDGTFSGWEGDTKNVWRIENETIIAGSMDKPAARNEFLCSTGRYSDFDLTLEFKTTGTEKINAGVQFRSELLRKRQLQDQPKPKQEYHAVIGYQADIGGDYHGYLYDEHRRRMFLAQPDKATAERVAAAIPQDGWQKYRIRATRNRVQLWLNGIKTVDFLETDESIWRKGAICLQIHGQMVGTIAYRNIQIRDLSKTNVARYSIEDMSWIAGRWTGEAMGGQFEETWNPPMGDEMMGMFKLVNDGKVVFYELMTIVPKNESYVLRLKHFGDGLVGWEEKDKSVEFPLESVTSKEIKFKGLKFNRLSKFAKDMIIEVETKKEAKTESLIFKCKRDK